jgi:hypothetical protein
VFTDVIRFFLRLTLTAELSLKRLRGTDAEIAIVAKVAVSVDVMARGADSELYVGEAVGDGGNSAAVGTIFRILTLILHILSREK